jgi:hypothetical protein
MKEKRAIYIGDIRYDKCVIFKLNDKTGYYEMIDDTDFRYEESIVNEDTDWLIFEVDKRKDKVKLLKAILS